MLVTPVHLALASDKNHALAADQSTLPLLYRP